MAACTSRDCSTKIGRYFQDNRTNSLVDCIMESLSLQDNHHSEFEAGTRTVRIRVSTAPTCSGLTNKRMEQIWNRLTEPVISCVVYADVVSGGPGTK